MLCHIFHVAANSFQYIRSLLPRNIHHHIQIAHHCGGGIRHLCHSFRQPVKLLGACASALLNFFHYSIYLFRCSLLCLKGIVDILLCAAHGLGFISFFKSNIHPVKPAFFYLKGIRILAFFRFGYRNALSAFRYRRGFAYGIGAVRYYCYRCTAPIYLPGCTSAQIRT